MVGEGRLSDVVVQHPWPQLKGHDRRYPIRKVITSVAVEGGVAGGALPMRAGTSFQGRRKPNGSAFQRRIMAAVQDAAKHAISAMSPLKTVIPADVN